MVGQTKTGTIDAAADYHLGEAASSRVSSWAVELISDSFVGSITVKAKGSASRDGTLQNKGYKNQVTEAAATAAITGTALILVDSSGLDVVLDCTAYTSGDLHYVATPVVG